jgi:RTA1 like protein
MTCDFFSLVLQGAGGGLSATADTVSLSNTGRYIMIAGMAFQVLSLSIFMALWVEFILRVRSSPVELKDAHFVNLRQRTSKFKAFHYGMLD